MKKRAGSSVASAAAIPSRSAKPSRRAWWVAGSLVLLVILSAGGMWVWQRQALLTRAHARLPPVSDLAGQSPVFAALVAEATDATRSAATVIAGAQELGRLCHANNFRNEAEACWQFLHREQPNEARWAYYLADLRRSASDQTGLSALLQETLRLAPDYTPARLQLANLQFKSGELGAAADNFRQRLARLPQDPYARLGLARLALQAGRKDEARAQLEQLLKDAPKFSTGHNLYAEILAGAGDAAGASRHRWLGQETLRYREPEDPWLDELAASCYDYDRLCVLGTLEVQTENLDRAESYFGRAIQLSPGNTQAYELMSNLLFKRNAPVKVRALLEEALPKLAGKKSPGFFVALSQAYRQLKQPGEALRVAQLGLAQAGEQPELYDALGLALAQAGRHEEAVAAWEAGLAKSPGDAGMNFNQAVSFLALRRLDDTLAALDRSLTLQPTFLPTLLLRGEIELDAGHLDLAEKYLRPAIESNPANAQARRLMADLQQQLNAAKRGR